MEITKYTLELDGNEMFELCYALQDTIENRINLTDNPKADKIFNEPEAELKLLQDFIDNTSQTLTVSERSEDGKAWKWVKNQKQYTDAEEWFEALLKQRRKEHDRQNKKNNS